MELIRTKFTPPSDPAGVQSRPRLAQRLNEVAQSRVTLVQAPAGYGKTTLLAQWRAALLEAGASAPWLTFDGGDRNPAGVAAYLFGMLDREPPGEPYSGDGLEAWVAGLVRTLAERGQDPVHIFFDDLQLLSGKAIALVSRFIEAAPANARFVLASRSAPDLPLGRLRAMGRLVELGPADLQFTLPEARTVLESAGHAPLTDEEIAAATRRTEGWAVGLRLLDLALRRDGDAKRAIASFNGRHRAVTDFFAEGVWGALPVDLREFLLETGVLGRLSPALCDAVTLRGGSREMIDRVEASGLFLLRLDQERDWYRYHSLFADFLSRRLLDMDPVATRDLHLRASRWCAQAGLIDEALDYAADAGDAAWLGQLLEDRCEEMTYAGKITVVAHHAETLPTAILNTLPKTLLTVAWLRCRNLNLRAARRLIETAQARIEAQEAAGLAADQLAALRMMLQHRMIMLAAAEDDILSVDEACERLLRESDGSRPYLECTLYAQLLAARRERFRFEDVPRLEAAVRALLRGGGLEFASIALQAVMGATLTEAGKIEAARRSLEEGLARAEGFAGPRSGLAALNALPLAELLYEQNELEAAGLLVEGHLPVARELGYVDQLIAGYLVRPRLLHAAGDIAGALEALDEGMQVALECGLERLELNLLAEQIRLRIRAGQPERAAEMAQAAGIFGGGADMAPRPGSVTRDELRALAWTRLAVSRDDLREALDVARAWKSFCTQHGAVRSGVRWGLLTTHILSLDGESQSAGRTLRETLALAAPANFVRPFLDAGPAIGALLRDGYADGVRANTAADVFAGALLSTLDGPLPSLSEGGDDGQGIAGRLVGRELEILTLVGAGMRNREIGARLGLTEGTVKWYMQQIYDKVGVRRRPQAVDRARQFGLIA